MSSVLLIFCSRWPVGTRWPGVSRRGLYLVWLMRTCKVAAVDSRRIYRRREFGGVARAAFFEGPGVTSLDLWTLAKMHHH